MIPRVLFNNETREVFTSSQYGSYAFVDNYSDKKPRKYSENTVFSLDINKCRRNIMLHNTENYPVFTVMDRIEKYVEKKKIKVGVYFVETDNVFPMRGNRWYHHTMIKYCLEQNIIKTSDIKYQIISSLSLRSNYFNKFIEHISNKLSDEKALLKLAVNSMIGKFKPKQTENWSSLCIQEDINNVFYHFLKNDGCFIKNRKINDKTFYHAYNKFFTEKDETESPLYHQILELEAIELHKLSKLIESKNGIILDLNTDAISFITKNNVFPFDISKDGVNIKDYYYNDNEELPKYKVENKNGRLCIPKLQGYKKMNNLI